MTRSRWTSLASFMLLAGCSLFAAGCVTNPATGRRQFNAMSTQEEIAVGEEAMPQLINEYGGVVEDPVLRNYVTRVGMSMTPHTEADFPNLPWEFTLLDSDVINAFALPGGKVFITRELLSEMTNEAQLAGVLGHEIAHVTAQHVDDRVGQSIGVQLLATLLGAATSQTDYAQIANVIVGVGGQGYLLKYGRDQELESDQLGMRYMTRAGYNPAAMLQVMAVLETANAESGGGPPEFLSTHPYPESRIEQIEELLNSRFRQTRNNPEYQYYEDRFEQVVGTRLD